MPGLEQAVAWLQEPYNQTALVLVQVAGAVLALALIAGFASAFHNWRRRRRLRRRAEAGAPPAPSDSPAETAHPRGHDPQAAYAAILRLTPNDARARKGASGLNT